MKQLKQHEFSHPPIIRVFLNEGDIEVDFAHDVDGTYFTKKDIIALAKIAGITSEDLE